MVKVLPHRLHVSYCRDFGLASISIGKHSVSKSTGFKSQKDRTFGVSPIFLPILLHVINLIVVNIPISARSYKHSRRHQPSKSRINNEACPQ